MDRGVFSSHSRYHLPKKEPMSPPRIRHYRLPHSPKHPGTDTGEDPHHQKPHEITVDHAHKTLLPPRDEAEHDEPIAHRLIGAYRYDTCMHLCPYAPIRRCRGVRRGQPLTDPSRFVGGQVPCMRRSSRVVIPPTGNVSHEWSYVVSIARSSESSRSPVWSELLYF
jgi:hypothetical protein